VARKPGERIGDFGLRIADCGLRILAVASDGVDRCGEHGEDLVALGHQVGHARDVNEAGTGECLDSESGLPNSNAAARCPRLSPG
jgi:hypothetical protein